MKKVMKKNQVIITALAILIAVAGYLNFTDVSLEGDEKEASTDSSTILEEADGTQYDLTDETASVEEDLTETEAGSEEIASPDEETGTPGEAVLTNSSSFAAQAKLSREQIRSQNKADLEELINNEAISEDQKQEAVNTMVEMTDMTEKEAAAELLLEAKGFEDVVVNLTGETADVVVPDAYLGDDQRAQIEDIVKRKTGIAASSIVITPLSESAAESDVDLDPQADVQEEGEGQEETQDTDGSQQEEESQEEGTSETTGETGAYVTE